MISVRLNFELLVVMQGPLIIGIQYDKNELKQLELGHNSKVFAHLSIYGRQMLIAKSVFFAAIFRDTATADNDSQSLVPFTAPKVDNTG